MNEPQFILIAGISGSGKTSYSEYLRDKHGFNFIETNGHDEFILEAIGPLNRGFVDRYVSQYQLVVMEWGFLPRFLPQVISLKEQGAKLFWFTAPDEFARAAYSTKWRNDPLKLSLWDTQRERQRKANLPTPHFQIIETVRPNNGFKHHEELDELIFRAHQKM